MRQFSFLYRMRGLYRLGGVAAMGLALGLASCGDRPDKAHPDAGDRVVARVEKHEIWASDVRREAVAQGLIGEGEPLDVTSELFRRVLDEVIDQSLLASEAERRGLDKSPAAQRRLESVRQRILGDMLVETVVDRTVSDEAVRRLYAEQQRRATKSEEVRLRLILTQTREQADAVIALLGQGASFEAVAAQRSIDEASRALGGDLGYATPDLLPPVYARAIANQPSGAVVGPVDASGRWAVLRIEDRRAETPPTLEQARPVIVRYLTYEGVRQLLEELRGKAKVEFEIDPPRSAPQTPPSASASAPAGSKAATPAVTAPVNSKSSSSGSAA
ncbi:peptidyl-prolyl cis-trans isomerase [uncultured Brevundimonas sp.]|uniref:peptidylprolyl isomerase n=1 Tax=uncultured Brevundimonas sp. TaxID=213418 RepID=UPI002614C791|nr:peptidyl-prolyl cis-trans isomerase [uncultured Brevundimonas sp.]